MQSSKTVSDSLPIQSVLKVDHEPGEGRITSLSYIDHDDDLTLDSSIQTSGAPDLSSLTNELEWVDVVPLSPLYDSSQYVSYYTVPTDESSDSGTYVYQCHQAFKSPGGHYFFNLGMKWSDEDLTPLVHVHQVGDDGTGCLMEPWGQDALAGADENQGVRASWLPLYQLANISFHQAPLSRLYATLLGRPLRHTSSAGCSSSSSGVASTHTDQPLRSIWCLQCGGVAFSTFFCRGIPHGDGHHHHFMPCKFSLCHSCGEALLSGRPKALAMKKVAYISHDLHTSRLTHPLRYPLHAFTTRPTLVLLISFLESNDIWKMPFRACEAVGIPPVGCGYYVFRWRCSNLNHVQYATQRMVSDFKVLGLVFDQVVIYIASHNHPMKPQLVTDQFVQELNDEMAVEKDFVEYQLSHGWGTLCAYDASHPINLRSSSMSQLGSTTKSSSSSSIGTNNTMMDESKNVSQASSSSPSSSINQSHANVPRSGPSVPSMSSSIGVASDESKEVIPLPANVEFHHLLCRHFNSTRQVQGREMKSESFSLNELASVLAPFVQQLRSLLPTDEHISLVLCSRGTRPADMQSFFLHLGMAESHIGLGIATDRPCPVGVFASWQMHTLVSYVNSDWSMNFCKDQSNALSNLNQSERPRQTFLVCSQFALSSANVENLVPRAFFFQQPRASSPSQSPFDTN